MKEFSERLAALVRGDPVSDEPPKGPLLSKSTVLIREHLIEIDAAIEIGYPREVILGILNQFLVEGRRISMGTFHNAKWRAKKNVNDYEAQKAEAVDFFNSQKKSYKDWARSENASVSTAQSRTTKGEAVNQGQGQADEDRSVISDPSDLREFRKNSDITFD